MVARVYCPPGRPGTAESPIAQMLTGTAGHSAVRRGSQYFVAAPLAESCAVVAPHSLRGYAASRAWSELEALAREARAAQKPLLVFSGAGDDDLRNPVAGCVAVSTSFERTAGRPTIVMPTLVDDPMEQLGLMNWSPAPSTAEPHVGFCGHGASGWLGYVRRPLKNLRRYGRALLPGCCAYPQTCVDHIRLRRRVIDALESHAGVVADFVIRDRYRAGIGYDEDASEARTVFHRNIYDNTYTLCVRGAGNFSDRLFSTLALGRIPLYVDSGSPLPFERVIDWDELVVRVPARDRDRAGDELVAFHAAQTADSLRARQERCRATWLAYLHKATYYAKFAELLDAGTIWSRD